MKKTEKKNGNHHGKYIVASAVVAAVAIIFVVVKPQYESYIETDRKETCEKARFYVMLQDNEKIESLLKAGYSEDEIDFEEAAKEMYREGFGITLQYDENTGLLYTDELCRSGGTITLHFDPESHIMTQHCDYKDHGDFVQWEWNGAND